MPLYIGVHRDDAAELSDTMITAHQALLVPRGGTSTRVLRYWLSPDARAVFCLLEAPDRSTVEAAHGRVGGDIVEVEEGT